MSNRTIVTPGIWASGAPDVPTTPATGTTYKDSGITPQNVIDALKYNTIADSSKLNEILYRLTALMLMLEQYGTLPFCPTTTYGAGGTCIGSNGVIYQSKADNNYGHDPVNDTSNTYWVVFVKDTNPIGTVLALAHTTIPAGYLECNGVAISRTTYSSLFAVLGTTWGAGNGTTTFNLPDFRGQFLRGYDNGRLVDIFNDGGAARVFGVHQPSKSLHVDSYQSQRIPQHDQVWGPITIPVDGSWGTYIVSGYTTTPNNNDLFIRFKMNGDETRPINETVTFVIKY